MRRRIGLLTGGGDCPGLNAVIRAVVRTAVERHSIACFGFRNGWRGVLDMEVEPLTVASTRGILYRGGTILGTSRVDPYREPDGVARIRETLEVHRLDGLVVIGGEGTLGAATRLAVDQGVPIVGIPKTIDNDVGGTEMTVGFLTAADIATGAVDRLHSTAESHNRVMVLEVMGRHAGWIAIHAGIAGGADAILIPEFPFDVGGVCRHVKQRAGSGRDFSIVVVAEGAVPAEGTMELPPPPKDQFGRPVLGGISQPISNEIERRTGFPARVTILGHVQRGGTPHAADRVLATRFGCEAVEMVQRDEWGAMTGLIGPDVVAVPLAEATKELKLVPRELYEVAETFFG
ncbi:MAG TPA: ATP-dependent 6-phosphofructokinase [Nitriliruptorales bacterium]|nr:ATP-dependent 6-phosphofructokinase [Nitriliruptorales bacterium]